ncbi:MAG: hypothetical protein ACK47B_22520 [Armatimonadota bacterium]
MATYLSLPADLPPGGTWVAGDFHRLRDGALVTAALAADGDRCRLLVCRWSDAEPPEPGEVQTVEPAGVYGVSLGSPGGEVLDLFYTLHGTRIYRRVSRDGGRTWGEPAEVPWTPFPFVPTYGPPQPGYPAVGTGTTVSFAHGYTAEGRIVLLFPQEYFYLVQYVALCLVVGEADEEGAWSWSETWFPNASDGTTLARCAKLQRSRWGGMHALGSNFRLDDLRLDAPPTVVREVDRASDSPSAREWIDERLGLRVALSSFTVSSTDRRLTWRCYSLEPGDPPMWRASGATGGSTAPLALDPRGFPMKVTQRVDGVWEGLVVGPGQRLRFVRSRRVSRTGEAAWSME